MRPSPSPRPRDTRTPRFGGRSLTTRAVGVVLPALVALLVASCVNLAPAVTASIGAGEDTGEITMADITGDHRADAVVARDDGVLFWFERCVDDSCLNLAGSVDAAPGVHDLAAGDVNRDGTADIVLATDNGIEVMFGNDQTRGHGSTGLVLGDSLFVTRGIYQHVIVGDLNHDGALDIGASDQSRYDLIVNDGGGSFRRTPQRLYTVTVPPSYLAAQLEQLTSGDFDGNGQLEGMLALRAITSTGSIHTVYLGLDMDTFTSFQEIADSLSGSLGVGDVNGDGHDDFAQFSALGGAILVSTWTTGGPNWPTPGTFTGVTSIQLPSPPNTVRLTDLDADHKVDLIVGQPNGLSYWHGDGLGGVMVVGGVSEFDHSVPGVKSFELASDVKDPRPNIVASIGAPDGTIAFIDNKP